LLVGGFGLCGIPMNLIEALSRRSDVRDLVIASNDGGAGDVKGDNAWGLEFLYKNKQVRRMISSFLGYNKHYEALYLGGEI
jgi:3-oxoacid CoA-transferase